MATDSQLSRLLDRIPAGHFILTAAHDGARSGVLVRWVQRCATSPPMVMVAVAPCLPVVPLIRDSHCFSLCRIRDDDVFLARMFAEAPGAQDPFDSIPNFTAPSGAPILQRAESWLDCSVARHIDLESDYGLYVGHVRDGGELRQ